MVRVAYNVAMVCMEAPMSALKPTPVTNPRIWVLPLRAKSGHKHEGNLFESRDGVTLTAQINYGTSPAAATLSG